MPSVTSESLAPSRVVLVHGSDSVAKSELVRGLLEAVEAGDELLHCRADERPMPDLVAEAGTPPFFSDRRVVVVRAAEEFDPAGYPGGAKRLEAELGALPETGMLVLVESEPGSDRADGQRGHGAAWRKLVKAAGGAVVGLDFDPKRLADDLRDQAKKHGKSLSLVAARTLADMVGGNGALGAMELRKLVAYVGDAPGISEEDVVAVTVAEQDYNVFALAESVLNGRTAEALSQLRRLFSGSRQVKDEVIPRIMPVVLSQIRMARQARALLDAGEDPLRPSDEARKWLPEKNVSQEPDWRYRRILGVAKRNDRRRLAAMLDLLADADARLKGLAAGAEPADTIEATLVAMSRVAAGAPATR